jgi:segregation and condensation protein A
MIAPNDPAEVEPVPTSGGAPPPVLSPALAERPVDFRVQLEDVYAGPLDLLLHLVKEHEVEISELSLARVCDDFLRYVRALAELDLGRAGDYLVVAATLIAMKSRSLVPTGEAVEFDEEIDPGDDLVKRLLQYRRVREVSRELGTRAARREMLYSRGDHEMPALEPGEFDLSDIGAWELLGAFAKILQEVGTERPSHRIRRPDRSIADFVREVARILLSKPSVRFEEIFEGAPDRDSMIGTFLALLELAKQGAIAVVQPELFGSIDIARRVENPEQFQRLVDGIADVEDQGLPASEALGGEAQVAEAPGVSRAGVIEPNSTVGGEAAIVPPNSTGA